jgi:Fe-S-cluster-containing dehydrogenase component
MNKWNLIVDVPLCENCNNCVMAAKDELVGNAFPGYTAPHAAQGPGVIKIRRSVRGSMPMVDTAYLPVMCNHCDDAPCMKGDSTGAISKRDDGIVLIDPVLAKGRRDLVAAYPYGAIEWNEVEQLPQTWFFDAHLLDSGWSAPRCESVCPTRVFEATKISDVAMAERAAKENLRTRNPEWGTKPRVYYRGMDRFDHCFIGGSVTAMIGGIDECIEGATAELRHDEITIARATTDAFGDFKFDGLKGDSGSYEIIVHHVAHGSARRRVTIAGASIYLGLVVLTESQN